MDVPMKNACLRVALAAWIVCAPAALVTPARAGLTDSIKKKVEKTVGDKSSQATDKANEKADAATGTKDAGTSAAPGASASGGASDDGGKISAVSTKFDFQPGDKVIFADDFTQDENGEFPSRWKLVDGTLEIAEMDGQRWLNAVGDNSKVRMKHGLAALPEFWTLEFDYFGATPFYGSFIVDGQDAGGNEMWHLEWSQGGGNTVFFRTGDILSSVPVGEPEALSGKHHVSILARGKALKIYFDRTRVVNTPEVKGLAADILFWMRDLRAKPMFSNVRFAEGPKPAKDLLASGKLVTYGIHFKTGSDLVEADSAPVLRDVSAYLKANPAVKLQITGHTDNVGSAASNLDLSKRRAASVARVLGADFGVEVERLTTDGKGDAQSIADNKTSEGRAMNRRVEFAKQ
jgi:hypothetical protein